MKLTNRLIISRQLAFALENVDFDTRWLSDAVEKISDFRVGIVVVAFDELGEHPAESLDSSESGVTSSNSTSLTSTLKHTGLEWQRRPPLLRPDSTLGAVVY
jgi:hypothetical protein